MQSAQHKLKGKLNSTGNIFIPEDRRYSTGVFDEHHLALYSQEGLLGLIDKNGTVLCPPLYDKITSFHNGFALVLKNGRYGCIDISGTELVETEYYLLSYFEDGLAWGQKEKNGIWELIKKEKGQLIKRKYSLVREFDSGYATCIDEDDHLLIINKKGEPVFQSSLTNLKEYWHKLFPEDYWLNEQQIDALPLLGALQPKTLINEKKSQAFSIKENMICYPSLVEQTLKYGFISLDEKIKIPAIYVEVEQFSDNYAVVKEKEGWNIINKSGKRMLSAFYQYLKHLEKDIFIAQTDNKYGVIDIKGQIKVPFEYTAAKYACREMIALRKASPKNIEIEKSNPLLFNVIDYELFRDWGGISIHEPTKSLPFQFNEIHPLTKCFCIGINYKVSGSSPDQAINMPLTEQSPTQNLSISDAELKRYILNMDFYFCNHIDPLMSTRIAIKPSYCLTKALNKENIKSTVHYYLSGKNYAFVTTENNLHIYDNEGRRLREEKIPATIHPHFFYPFKIYSSKKDNKYGAQDADARVICDFSYDKLEIGFAGIIVKKGNFYGYLDLSGKEILPTRYIELIENNRGQLKAKDSTGTFFIDKKGIKTKQ